ncbi:hypothetical protein M153_4990001931 [Pseudoloma neurophilia]|uniref:Uncharacterized protein n=1 Tax=Pseudoloma neurophilia TaxID=146866 RepID=A0A0R0LX29_9MICR|nr:hypothetical protein M153_4990001931 [Pseudoloma neurophilia]
MPDSNKGSEKTNQIDRLLKYAKKIEDNDEYELTLSEDDRNDKYKEHVQNTERRRQFMIDDTPGPVHGEFQEQNPLCDREMPVDDFGFNQILNRPHQNSQNFDESAQQTPNFNTVHQDYGSDGDLSQTSLQSSEFSNERLKNDDVRKYLSRNDPLPPGLKPRMKREVHLVVDGVRPQIQFHIDDLHSQISAMHPNEPPQRIDLPVRDSRTPTRRSQTSLHRNGSLQRLHTPYLAMNLPFESPDPSFRPKTLEQLRKAQRHPRKTSTSKIDNSLQIRDATNMEFETPSLTQEQKSDSPNLGFNTSRPSQTGSGRRYHGLDKNPQTSHLYRPHSDQKCSESDFIPQTRRSGQPSPDQKQNAQNSSDYILRSSQQHSERQDRAQNSSDYILRSSQQHSDRQDRAQNSSDYILRSSQQHSERQDRAQNSSDYILRSSQQHSERQDWAQNSSDYILRSSQEHSERQDRAQNSSDYILRSSQQHSDRQDRAQNSSDYILRSGQQHSERQDRAQNSSDYILRSVQSHSDRQDRAQNSSDYILRSCQQHSERQDRAQNNDSKVKRTNQLVPNKRRDSADEKSHTRTPASSTSNTSHPTIVDHYHNRSYDVREAPLPRNHYIYDFVRERFGVEDPEAFLREHLYSHASSRSGGFFEFRAHDPICPPKQTPKPKTTHTISIEDVSSDLDSPSSHSSQFFRVKQQAIAPILRNDFINDKFCGCKKNLTESERISIKLSKHVKNSIEWEPNASFAISN